MPSDAGRRRLLRAMHSRARVLVQFDDEDAQGENAVASCAHMTGTKDLLLLRKCHCKNPNGPNLAFHTTCFTLDEPVRLVLKSEPTRTCTLLEIACFRGGNTPFVWDNGGGYNQTALLEVFRFAPEKVNFWKPLRALASNVKL